MAKDESKTAAPDSPAPVMTQAELIAAVTQAAVSAALKATEGKRQLSPTEVRDKVQRIKGHTGEYEKKPKPETPPPGYAIFGDRFGRNPKMVEAHRFLSSGAKALPLHSGPGERAQIIPTGTYMDSMKNGDRQLLKLNLYPAGKIVNKKGQAVDQRLLLPTWGDDENPIPFDTYFKEVEPGLFVNKAIQASA